MTWLFFILIWRGEIKFVEPQGDAFAGATRIVLKTDLPAEDIVGIELFVNGKTVHFFEEPPFETDLDFGDFGEGPLELKAVLHLFGGEDLVAVTQGRNFTGFYQEQVKLVRVPVLAPDSPRPWSGEDFQIFENGAAQKLDFIYTEAQPLSLVILLDLSTSMEKRLPVVRRSLYDFLDLLAPQDRVQVVGFSHRIFEICQLESDKDLVKRSMISIRTEGSTNLYGAIWSGAQILSRIQARRALLLFTDGQHELGQEPDLYNKTLEEGVELARYAGVPIYTMGAGVGVQPDILREVSGTTGGKYFYLSGARSIREAFQTIASEIRRQYLLCYHSRSTRVGWHDIQVQLTADPQALLRYPNRLYFP